MIKVHDNTLWHNRTLKDLNEWLDSQRSNIGNNKY